MSNAWWNQLIKQWFHMILLIMTAQGLKATLVSLVGQSGELLFLSVEICCTKSTQIARVSMEDEVTSFQKHDSRISLRRCRNIQYIGNDK